MDLTKLSTSYLKAEGYEVVEREKGLLVGERLDVGSDVQTVYVWVPDRATKGSEEDGGDFERRLMREFGHATKVDPGASRFLLVRNIGGLSTEFRRDAKQYFNVNVRVPIQFFDTAFKSEVSPTAYSAAKDLRDRGEKARELRIPQPYSTLDVGGEQPANGADLLHHLFERLRAKDSKSIHVVVGPAGVGKSMLFESLFARLYGAFLEDKRAQKMSPRPLPLLPQHLAVADAATIKSLLKGFLQTDFARPLNLDVFTWMMSNGLSLWLLDGLDEVIATDPEFFERVLDLITTPGGEGSPRILVCVRDSLLATNDGLQRFVEDCSAYTCLYRLEKWGAASKKAFASVALGDRAGDFLGVVRSKPALEELSATPYYCRLLADEFQAGAVGKDFAEDTLLRVALHRIIEREYEKKVLDRDAFPEEQVVQLLEEIATEDLSGGGRGVRVETLRELVPIVLQGDLDEKRLERMITQATQMALFTAGGSGEVRFAQEILEHFLLARAFINMLDKRPDSLLRYFARSEVPHDWITLRLVGDHAKRTGGVVKLRSLLLEAPMGGHAFRNLLQLASLSADRPDALKDLAVEGVDLHGLSFAGLDFGEMSFRRCDLTNVEFVNCDLRAAHFEDAVLQNTRFEVREPSMLRGASFGGLTRFYSVRLDGRTIGDQEEARRWFERQTGVPAPVVRACPAALQLRHLFQKFVRENGQPRRDWLDRRGVLAGKAHVRPEMVLETSIRFGYLAPDKGRDRITRTRDRRYNEIVDFMTRWAVTPGLSAVLDECCRTEGCTHVPRLGS